MSSEIEILQEIIAVSNDHQARINALKLALEDDDVDLELVRPWSKLIKRACEKYNGRMVHLWDQHAALKRDRS